MHVTHICADFRPCSSSRTSLAQPQPQRTFIHTLRSLRTSRRILGGVFFLLWFKGYGLDMEKEIGVGLQANGEYRGRCVAHMDAIYWVKR